MKGMEIRQNILNFQIVLKKCAVHSKVCIAKKNNKKHYPTRIPILALNVFLYIFEVKKGCKKKV